MPPTTLPEAIAKAKTKRTERLVKILSDLGVGHLITDISNNKLKAALEILATSDDQKPEELERRMARAVGLNKAQRNAVNAFYEKAKKDKGLAVARRESIAYSNQLRKDRAKVIVRTEMVRIREIAKYQQWNIDPSVKTVQWITAKDEMVCPVCRPLHRKKAKKGANFSGGILMPPAHPNCRCELRPL